LQLALNWNIGEESSNAPKEREVFSNFIKKLDPYNHPIVSHSASTGEQREEIYGPLLGQSNFDGASLNLKPEEVHDTSLEWLKRSAIAGHRWIVSNDEQQPSSLGVVPDSEDPSHDLIRKFVLWGNLMAGGRLVIPITDGSIFVPSLLTLFHLARNSGVEYYFGVSRRDKREILPHKYLLTHCFPTLAVQLPEHWWVHKVEMEGFPSHWNFTKANSFSLVNLLQI